MVEGSMSVSIFDIFKVEIDPFGSPAVGLMIGARHLNVPRVDEHPMPYSFRSAGELLRMCKASGRTIADLMLENEKCWRSTYDIRAGILEIAAAMEACIARGCPSGGSFPGPIQVRRPTAERDRQLSKRLDSAILHAMALNREKARGGRIAAAPPNGAGGIIAAVLQYYRKFVAGANEDGVVDFLLTAAAIGIIGRENASIFGSEAGSQAEVEVACAMAAAGLAAVLGGSNEQIENAIDTGLNRHPGISSYLAGEHGRRPGRGGAFSAA
ncbi:L-serine dehydratase (fragment) [Cupriavidus taiwanensis]